MTPLTQSSIEETFADEGALQKTAAQVAADIKSGNYSIQQFVETLGFALTSSNVQTRVNGTKMLSSTLAALPKDFLNELQLEFLMNFYADRLKDYSSVMPTVIDGMAALVQMQHLPERSIPILLQSFFQNTTCQSQVRSDRAKLFEIFKQLSQQHVDTLKAMKADFICGIISAIDGERDPRNLNFIFDFMPEFIQTYPLLHLSEEMFEIFACYFPIDFTPNANEPNAVTRQNLADKLTQCLVAHVDFIEWTVPLALEKLDSDLTVAKLDALQLLQAAAQKFPATAWQSQFEEIWTALKKHVFPGADNEQITATALATLRTCLEQAAAVPDISSNLQTLVLATVLPHLSDVQQRLFQPAIAIGLVCTAADAALAGNKVLNTLLLKLTDHSTDDGERLKIYAVLAQIFKIVAIKQQLTSLLQEYITQIHANVIEQVRVGLEQMYIKTNADLKHAALSVLNESAPLLSEANRALVYKALLLLIKHDTLDLELVPLLQQLGALQPIELHSNVIAVCTQDFAAASHFVKGKIFKNLLPLVRQLAFTQSILDLVLTHVFENKDETVRLLALQALNTLLNTEDAQFVQTLHYQHCLIDKLIALAQQQTTAALELNALEQISSALSSIMRQLALSEQYAIASTHLPTLNLQLAADLFIAKGLLGFLHQQISLNDHFEQLINDLTKLSLESDNAQLRAVAHHLLCSLVNKIEDNADNKGILLRSIEKLRQEIKLGNAKAVEVLSWLGKALTVRGADEAGEIIETLAELLEHPTLSEAACLAFDIISAEYPQLHLPVVKFLFKQKFFHTIMKKLGNKLETYCENHLNAFVYVLQATPHAVLKMNIEKIGSILFKCLETKHKNTICVALKICENFVSQADEYFRNHLNHLIPSCLQLSTYADSMQVRITALNLLHDITKYPVYVLLPYKTDVVLELVDALDDKKRLVRNAAVKARNEWFLVGSAGNQ